MYKTIAMLDEIARQAEVYKEVMFLMITEETIDLFIKRYGGKRCADNDHGKYIDYNGCKILYSTIDDAKRNAKIRGEEIRRELEQHQNTLKYFRDWGVHVQNVAPENNLKNIQGFLREYKELCERYKLSISHEDTYGAFEIHDYSESLIEWINDATDKTVRIEGCKK